MAEAAYLTEESLGEGEKVLVGFLEELLNAKMSWTLGGVTIGATEKARPKLGIEEGRQGLGCIEESQRFRGIGGRA